MTLFYRTLKYLFSFKKTVSLAESCRVSETGISRSPGHMQSGRQSHVNLKLKEVFSYELHHFQLTMIDSFLQKFATEPCCPVRTTVGQKLQFWHFLEFKCLEHID